MSTRKDVLMLLKKQTSMTAKAISEQLHLTISAIRQQLAQLEAEGLVEVKHSRNGPGRPLNVYHLTEKAENEFPKSYDRAALGLLQVILEFHGQEMLDEIATRGHRVWAENYKQGIDSTADFRTKLQQFMSLHSQLNFMPEAQEESGEVSVIQHNCPYLELAKVHPSVCEIERKIYEEMLGRPVELAERQTQGCAKCVFRCGKSEE